MGMGSKTVVWGKRDEWIVFRSSAQNKKSKVGNLVRRQREGCTFSSARTPHARASCTQNRKVKFATWRLCIGSIFMADADTDWRLENPWRIICLQGALERSYSHRNFLIGHLSLSAFALSSGPGFLLKLDVYQCEWLKCWVQLHRKQKHETYLVLVSEH